MNKTFKILATALLSTAILLSYTNAKESNESKLIKKNGKNFTEYIVNDGESLYEISKKTGITQEDIIKYNEKTINGAKKGMKLLLPVYQKAKVAQDTIIINNDVEIIQHTVQPKETIFRISKKYGISQATIAQYNPEVETGLKAGQVLRIPKFETKKVASETAKSQTTILRYQYTTEHTVAPKETLYGICRMYNVKSEDLIELNPELKDGLKAGQTIIIPNAKPKNKKTAINEPTAKTIEPQKTETANSHPVTDKSENKPSPNVRSYPSISQTTTTTNSTTIGHISKSGFTTISIMLPFMLDNQDADSKTDRFIEFYEGVLIGVGELKDKGYNIKLNVIDTYDGEAGVAKALREHHEIANSNYIIGPAYGEQVAVLNKYSKEKKIPLIVPLTKNVVGLTNNPYIYQFNGKEGALFDIAAEKCIEEFKDKNVIVVTFNNDYNDEGSEFGKYLLNAAKKQGIIYKTTAFSQSTWQNLNKLMTDIKGNVLVLATEEKTLIHDLLPQINKWKTTGLNISVLGQEAWGNDISTVSNTYYYSAFKILEGNRFNTYNAKYRREFGNSSTKNPRFDLIGRDLIMNIAGETDGIQSNLRWRKVGNGGHVNNGASLIKVSNGNRTTAR